MTYRCELCWTDFDSPVALLEHEAREDDQLYEVDGLYEPSTKAETQWAL